MFENVFKLIKFKLKLHWDLDCSSERTTFHPLVAILSTVTPDF